MKVLCSASAWSHIILKLMIRAAFLEGLRFITCFLPSQVTRQLWKYAENSKRSSPGQAVIWDYCRITGSQAGACITRLPQHLSPWHRAASGWPGAASIPWVNLGERLLCQLICEPVCWGLFAVQPVCLGEAWEGSRAVVLLPSADSSGLEEMESDIYFLSHISNGSQGPCFN